MLQLFLVIVCWSVRVEPKLGHLSSYHEHGVRSATAQVTAKEPESLSVSRSAARKDVAQGAEKKGEALRIWGVRVFPERWCRSHECQATEYFNCCPVDGLAPTPTPSKVVVSFKLRQLCRFFRTGMRARQTPCGFRLVGFPGKSPLLPGLHPRVRDPALFLHSLRLLQTAAGYVGGRRLVLHRLGEIHTGVYESKGPLVYSLK